MGGNSKKMCVRPGEIVKYAMIKSKESLLTNIPYNDNPSLTVGDRCTRVSYSIQIRLLLHNMSYLLLIIRSKTKRTWG